MPSASRSHRFSSDIAGDADDIRVSPTASRHDQRADASPNLPSSASRSYRRPSTTLSGSTEDYTEEEWEAGIGIGSLSGEGRTRKRDEPMSPVVVVCEWSSLVSQI